MTITINLGTAGEPSRAIRYPVGDTRQTILPVAATRAGKYLAFDAEGDVVTSTGTGADAGLRADLADTDGLTLVGVGGDTLATALGPTFEQYGAVGDGVANDSAAIAACIAANRYCVGTPGKTYRMVTPAAVPSDREVFGRGSTILLDPAANNVGAFDCSNSIGVKIHGFTFDGGAAARTTTRNVNVWQFCIWGQGCERIEICDNVFDDFVASPPDIPGVISLGNCRNVSVHDNYFGTGNILNVDVDVYYRAGDVRIVNNTSYSYAEGFAYCSTVGYDEDWPNSAINKTENVVITGNIILKGKGQGKPDFEVGSQRMHGIHLHYNGGRAYATVANNVIIGCGRHGLYLRGGKGPASPLDYDTGPWVVSGNIIRFCGGAINETNYWGYNNGIVIDSTLGGIVSDNIIEDSGYYPDGTARPYKASAIASLRPCRDISIVNNKINRSTGYPISIQPTVSSAISDPRTAVGVHLVGNTVRGMASDVSAGIIVLGLNDFILFANTRIERNSIYLTAAEQTGILVNYRLSESQALARDNYIEGTGASKQFGIGFPINMSGVIDGTEGKDLTGAVACVAGVAQPVPIGLPPHKWIGTQVIITNTIARDCGSLLFTQGDDGQLRVLDPSNSTLGTTPAIPVTISPGNSPIIGRRFQGLVAGDGRVEILSTNIPTEQAYLAGDRIIYPTPSAAGKIGAVCVTGGTPGTWKEYGAIDA